MKQRKVRGLSDQRLTRILGAHQILHTKGLRLVVVAYVWLFALTGAVVWLATTSR